jgi:HEAT repeat protein
VAKLRQAKDVDALLHCLDSPNDLPRAAQAAEALADLGEPRAVARLVKALQYGLDFSKGKVVEYAASALAKIGRPAVQPLTQFLERNHKDSIRCACAACILGQIATPDAVEALLGLLTHSDSQVKTAAVLCLGEAEDTNAVPHILALAKDNNTHAKVKMAIAMALGRLKEDQAADCLAGLAKDSNAEVRRYAVEAMAEWRDGAFAEQLAESLIDVSGQVQMQAKYGLMLLGQTSVPALSEKLRHAQPALRLQAAAMLGKIGGADAILALLEAAAENTETLGKAARRRLIEMGEAAVEPLATLLQDEQCSIRALAVEVLCDIGTEGARNAVSQAAQNGPDSVRQVAADAMDQMAGRTSPASLKWTEVQLPLKRGLTPLPIRFPEKCIFCGGPKETEKKCRVKEDLVLEVPYCRQHRRAARLGAVLIFAILFLFCFTPIMVLTLNSLEDGIGAMLKSFLISLLPGIFLAWGVKVLLSRRWTLLAATPFGCISMFAAGTLALDIVILRSFLVLKFWNAQVARECEQLSLRGWEQAPQKMGASDAFLP